MSRLFIKVKAGAKEDSVKQTDKNHFEVRVKARPQDGKANEAVIKALAEHFETAKSNITILSGHSSRSKIIEIL